MLHMVFYFCPSEMYPILAIFQFSSCLKFECSNINTSSRFTRWFSNMKSSFKCYCFVDCPQWFQGWNLIFNVLCLASPYVYLYKYIDSSFIFTCTALSSHEEADIIPTSPQDRVDTASDSEAPLQGAALIKFPREQFVLNSHLSADEQHSAASLR